MSKTINVIFSGQGAQYPGMFRDLYVKSKGAREIFGIADEVLDRSISTLCFQGTQEELDLTCNTQPCVLACDLAAFSVAKEAGICPGAYAGFSLGEYAAVAAAGVISLEDAFRLISIRAEAMQKAVPEGKGAMAAIMKQSLPEIEKLCGEVKGYVVPANLNSPIQTVISGEAEAVDEVLHICREKRIRAVKLPVSAPFHCALMEPAKNRLEEVFENVDFRDAEVPVYMNVDGKNHTSAEEIKRCLLMQTVSRVQWIETVSNMASEHGNGFLELGPGKTLTGFVNKICPGAETANIENEETLENARRVFVNE